MPFTVGQYLTANDLKSQEDAHTLGYGVVNGLKVVPTDPASMDVQVETGKAYVSDTLVEKGAVTNLTVSGADPSNPRKDIVVCNSAGTLSIVAGTPEAALPSGNVGVYTLNPEPPSIPANSIILGEIWVPAGATEITGSEIYDKRVPIADFLTHKDAATGVHGVGASTVCSETELSDAITAHVGDKDAHHTNLADITFIIDGGGAAITTSSKGYLEIPFACTITGWTISADQSGSIVVDVKKCTYAGFPTTTSIAGTEKPTLSTAQKNQDLSLTTWTTAIAAGDILEFVVDSATTVTRVTVSLKVTKT